ncbi:MAG TPA: phosphoribosylamine--glycine ligase [Bacteroidales bacterium]|nr:phosphoribosylamine--glycine ligase [Bacteroidales bacterium]
MNVLIIGSGGREHALAWKIAQSPLLDQLFVAPGNAGTNDIATNIPVGVTDFDRIKKAVLENNIGLVVVGPEAPLVAGIHDFFLADADLAEVPVIGPDRKGALLEGSKDFAKAFMTRYGIPTGRYQSFGSGQVNDAEVYLGTMQPPYVLKADGLAAGKGVLILDDYETARHELGLMLEGKFGLASETVVIEEHLSGVELSVFVLTDGDSYVVLPEAKDYKRIGEGDTGLNTGGMGAVSPVPFADKAFMKKVEDRIIRPTVEGLKKEHIVYKGFIFIGLMNVNGDPFVIEYNVRLGDPETEVVMPRVDADFLELLVATGEGKLAHKAIRTDPRTACTVMLVSGGYPGSYEKGKVIGGLDDTPGSIVFHAGTTMKDKVPVTAGGRVLAVTSYGRSMDEALDVSYRNAEKITFDGKYYRKDIGFDIG